MRGTVSPKLTDFLSQVNEAAAEAKAQGVSYTPEIVRGNLNKLAAFIPQGPDIAYVKDKSLAVGEYNLQVRVYSPEPSKALPVLIHYHGGGHMCGNVDLYDPISRQIADMAQCVVICPEYRLAPEHPYPIGVNDCEAVLAKYAELLEDVEHMDDLYILGDSAGGAICTTLSMRSQVNPALKIDKQILIYPSVDYTMSLPSVNENGEGFLLEQARVKWYFEQYFQESYNDKRAVEAASPLLNEFSSTMPETIIFTAGCDPLRDEGIAYMQKLKDASVPVIHHQLDGMIHAYMLLHDLVADECMETYRHIADFIKTK